MVCHRCDNPACVRPSHLFLGTAADNTADMVAKGRQARGEKLGTAIKAGAARGQRNGMALYPERRPRGEGHGNSKLTEAGVRAIRRRLADGEPKSAIARDFSVTPRVVLLIARGQAWAHVPEAR